jgi:aspartate aminotransferase
MTIGFNTYKDQIAKLGITTNVDLANYILEKYTFAMLPGIDFGFEKEDLFFRIAFVDFNGEEVLQCYKETYKIDLNFLKNKTPNIFAGVEKVKRFMKDLEG